MAFIPMPYVFQQELDDNGDPLSGGKIYAYEAGTDTPKDTYTDSTGATPNANPVILDASGRAEIWLGPGAYKFVIDDADDNNIDTRDNILGAINQAFGAVVESISGNKTLDAGDKNTHFNATSALTVSLPAAATAEEGYVFSLRNSSSGAVTIDPDGSETVNGDATLTLSPGESALVITNGSEWWALFIQQPSLHLDKSADYTVVVGDQGKLLLVDASSAAVTITLPPVASTVDGFELSIKKTDSSTNIVTIDGNSTETIDGSETYVIYEQYDSLSIKGDTAAWYIKNKDFAEFDPTFTKTADYTVTTADHGRTFLVDSTSADVTLTLPSAATRPGMEITVKLIEATNTAIIDGDSSETIDGDATKALTELDNSCTIKSDGTNWVVLHQIVIIDEDDMASDSTEHVPTQQSVKAYAQEVWTYAASQTLSGASSRTFSGIPAGVSAIHGELISRGTTNGNVTTSIRLGDDGGVESTGYVSRSTIIDDNSTADDVIVEATSTTDLLLTSVSGENAAHIYFELSLIDAATNLWSFKSTANLSADGKFEICNGHKALSEELTQIQIRSSNGNFDAGTAYVRYR